MSRVEASWLEAAEHVFVRRHAELDVNAVLVLGRDRALVIDTAADPTAGAALHEAVREHTDLPLLVALTHGHYDHCHGTIALAPAAVYAHRRFRMDPARDSFPVTWPDHLVDDPLEVDLGGRTVVLAHPGPAHTDHDLVIGVPDADTVVVGDLVEQSADPDIEDAYLDRWPGALGRILSGEVGGVPVGAATVVVPGHGIPVGRSFVLDQRDALAALAQRS